ncbi:hypothetical protein L873DRAFT_1795847 [Choiromyces venosus 120613-1]|uniref:Uncharacterized protein n=1 Tax=Choiromyces venosus 120613-1 TaxID=1336337 RepID=A0A3N4J092_9PEZI|nr:hypothetical protein L873DRAFT_1795847 [Choiromyces venosus 120613-1]
MELYNEQGNELTACLRNNLLRFGLPLPPNPTNQDLINALNTFVPGALAGGPWRQAFKLPDRFDGDFKKFEGWKSAVDRWVTANPNVPAATAVAMILNNTTDQAQAWAATTTVEQFLSTEEIKSDLGAVLVEPQQLDLKGAVASLLETMNNLFADAMSLERARGELATLRQGLTSAAEFIPKFVGIVQRAGYHLDDEHVLDRLVHTVRKEIKTPLEEAVKIEGLTTFVEISGRIAIYDKSRKPQATPEPRARAAAVAPAKKTSGGRGYKKGRGGRGGISGRASQAPHTTLAKTHTWSPEVREDLKGPLAQEGNRDRSSALL